MSEPIGQEHEEMVHDDEASVQNRPGGSQHADSSSAVPLVIGQEREGMVHNDEATVEDRLGRSQYAESFATVIRTCDTPLVIGLYGTWGVGKTSLMMLIREHLERSEEFRTVWFDAWMHQFDENPAIALVQTMVKDLELGNDGKKILMVVASALGDSLLRITTAVSAKDIQKFGEKYESEHFQIREKRIQVREYLEKLVRKAQLRTGQRIVVFIDDLDRCMPPQALRVLEALKLYLNLKDCVFVLGVDRQNLERCIKGFYKDESLAETDYLDKIVQLPFNIPMISPESMDGFVSPLLTGDLVACKRLLLMGLGDNPRRVKRFINSLTLNHEFAQKANISPYHPLYLALILIIQVRSPRLYQRLAIDRKADVLRGLLREDSRADSLRKEYLSEDTQMLNILRTVEIPVTFPVMNYIYLTETTKGPESEWSTERRVFPRRRIPNQLVSVSLLPDSGEATSGAVGSLIDISAGGFACFLDEKAINASRLSRLLATMKRNTDGQVIIRLEPVRLLRIWNGGASFEFVDPASVNWLIGADRIDTYPTANKPTPPA